MKIVGMVLLALALAAVAAFGLLGKAQAEERLRHAEVEVAAALAGQARARQAADEAEARAASGAGELAGLRKDLEKARADLDLAKQSMIDLRASATRADTDRLAAAEKARAAGVARIKAEATAAAKTREAETAKAGLDEARARADAAETAIPETPATTKAPSGKEAAACAAIAEAINFASRGDLTNPDKVAPAYLEWLTAEGGWTARDVVDLGAWLSDYWTKWDALRDPTRKVSRATADEEADILKKLNAAILQVRKEFLDGSSQAALKTFRFWNPRTDFSR